MLTDKEVKFTSTNTISTENTGITICIVQTHTTALKAHGSYNSKFHRYSKNVGVTLKGTVKTWELLVKLPRNSHVFPAYLNSHVIPMGLLYVTSATTLAGQITPCDGILILM